jgi:hypothetical protein
LKINWLISGLFLGIKLEKLETNSIKAKIPGVSTGIGINLWGFETPDALNIGKIIK